MTPRRLTKELEAGGTFPLPNAGGATPERKQSDAGNESPVNRVTPMQWQWEVEHPVYNTAMRPPTPKMERTPTTTPTKRAPDNRASPSRKAPLPSSSSPRDQLMEWNWSVEVALPGPNGAPMQFHPPVPSPAASPRKNDAVVVRRGGGDADRRSETPKRDSALGDSNPEIDAGSSATTTTTTTPSKTGVVKAALGKLNIFDRSEQKKTDPLLPKPYPNPRPIVEVRPMIVNPPTPTAPTTPHLVKNGNGDNGVMEEKRNNAGFAAGSRFGDRKSRQKDAESGGVNSISPSTSGPKQKVFVSACLNRSIPGNMISLPLGRNPDGAAADAVFWHWRRGR